MAARAELPNAWSLGGSYEECAGGSRSVRVGAAAADRASAGDRTDSKRGRAQDPHVTWVAVFLIGSTTGLKTRAPNPNRRSGHHAEQGTEGLHPHRADDRRGHHRNPGSDRDPEL